MKISDLCIRRPVFATVLSLVSYTRLPVREYPKIDEPVVTVDTTYRGASAEIVESQISKPLEDSLAGIEGVDVITSISRQENSQISVRFKLELRTRRHRMCATAFRAFATSCRPISTSR